MATERIDIVIRQDGARVVSRDIKGIGDAAESSSRGVDLMKRALGALGTLLAVNKVAQYADAWESATGQIRIATKSTDEAAAVTERLFKAAQQTRQGFTGMTELYSRSARAATTLGASQNELIDFSTNIGKALAVQHVTQEQAKGSLLQLGQALGAGIVRAEEFNSIVEGTPYILQIVAENMKSTGGTIAGLRKQMLDGKLTSQQFFAAFQAGAAKIEADFKKSGYTIGQSVTVVSNAFMKMVGELNESLGISKAVAVAANFIADNMDHLAVALTKVTTLLIGAAAAYGVFYAAQKVSVMTAAISATLEYSRAVAAGTVVTLGSAQAQLQRSTYAAAAATATEAAAAAQAAANAEIVLSEASVALATARTGAIRASVAMATATAQREAVIASLATVQADMAASRASIAAAEAAGAQSFAIATKRTALAALAAQEATYATQLTLLANLDRQRIGASIAQTEALAAQTVAQTALNSATAAGTATQATAASTAAAAATAQAAAASAAGATGASVFAQALARVQAMAVAAFGAVARLFALVNAHPFVAVATAVIALITLMYTFGDTVAVAGTDFATLRDVVVVFGRDCLDVLRAVGGAFGDAFDGVVSMVGSVFTAITGITTDAVKTWFGSFVAFFDGTGDGFIGLLRKVARVFDAFGGMVLGFVYSAANIFGKLPAVFGQVWSNVKNVAIDYIEGMINLAIMGMNKIASITGMAAMDSVKLERDKLDDTVFSKFGADAAVAFAEGYESQGGMLEKKIASVVERANELGKQRLMDMPATKRTDLDAKAAKSANGGMDEKSRKALEKEKQAFQSLLGSIYPVTQAKQDLAHAAQILANAQQKGWITADASRNALEMMTKQLEDQLDPLGAVNRELQQQFDLLGMTADARERQAQQLAIEKDLINKGIVLTQADTAALREKLRAMQEQIRLTQAQDALLANSVGARQQFGVQGDAINKLSQDPNSGFTAGDKAQAVYAMAPDALERTQAQADAQVAAIEAMYAQIDVLRQKNLISEDTAAQARAGIDAKMTEQRLKGTRDMFGMLASLSQSGNKKVAAIGKAAAVATATMDGIVAVQKALAAPPGWPYNAGTVIATGAAAAANVAKLAGFEAGGYTGNAATNAVSGVVHGQEFVVNAAGTARNRAALEAMNRGESINGTGGGETKMVVNVFNNADGTRVRQQERETPTGREMDIIIENAVAKNIKQGGGIASAVESQYGLNRAAGATR